MLLAMGSTWVFCWRPQVLSALLLSAAGADQRYSSDGVECEVLSDSLLCFVNRNFRRNSETESEHPGKWKGNKRKNWANSNGILRQVSAATFVCYNELDEEKTVNFRDDQKIPNFEDAVRNCSIGNQLAGCPFIDNINNILKVSNITAKN